MPSPGELTGQQRAAYVQSLFARVAPHYDLVNGLITGGRHLAWRRKTLRRAVAYLSNRTNSRLARGLDLCCGTGDYVFLLQEILGQDARLAGLDFCEPMLRIAIERNRRTGVEAAWLCGDATDLSFFQDATFDLATVGFGLRNVVDLPAALRETARVLRPGGLFVSLELARPERGPLQPLIFAYLRWFLPCLANLAKGGREDYLWLRRSLETFPGIIGLTNLLESSGLEVLEICRFGVGAVAGHIARRKG